MSRISLDLKRNGFLDDVRAHLVKGDLPCARFIGTGGRSGFQNSQDTRVQRHVSVREDAEGSGASLWPVTRRVECWTLIWHLGPLCDSETRTDQLHRLRGLGLETRIMSLEVSNAMNRLPSVLDNACGHMWA